MLGHLTDDQIFMVSPACGNQDLRARGACFSEHIEFGRVALYDNAPDLGLKRRAPSGVALDYSNLLVNFQKPASNGSANSSSPDNYHVHKLGY
jgi:hypothetical protein